VARVEAEVENLEGRRKEGNKRKENQGEAKGGKWWQGVGGGWDGLRMGEGGYAYMLSHVLQRVLTLVAHQRYRQSLGQGSWTFPTITSI
jgi:hypothetical protein